MNKTHLRPFSVLALCFLLQGGTLGIMSNCRGIFFGTICSDLGISLGTLTNYSLFYGVALCLAIPFAAKAVRKYNLRLVLTLFALAASAAEYVMSFFTAAWQWYIAAAIQGVSYAMLVVMTVPMLIANWFSTGRGTFIGISSISSGLLGALMNSLAGRVILEQGWRAGYRFLGIALFLLLVPACLAFSVRCPSDIGAQPYEGKVSAKQQIQRGQDGLFPISVGKTAAFWLVGFYALFICLAVSFNQILSSLATEIGIAPQSAPIFVSVAMMGTIVFKIFIGRLIDTRGIAFACFSASISVVAGMGLLLLSRGASMLFLGSLLMGMPMAVSVVLIQAMVRGIFGSEEFSSKYSKISVAINLSSNISLTIIGWVVSFSGTYKAAVIFGIATALVALAVAFILFKPKKEPIQNESGY